MNRLLDVYKRQTKISAETNAEIKFGYCTEFIIMAEKLFTEKDEQEFKTYLESIGDSIVCVADDEIVKVHVHTNDPVSYTHLDVYKRQSQDRTGNITRHGA